MIVEITPDNFEAEVLESDIPCLLDFYGEWCEPCSRLAPHFEELAPEYEGRVKFCKVDVDLNKDLRIKFLAVAVPLVVYVHEDMQTQLFNEVVSTELLRDRLDLVLAAGKGPNTKPLDLDKKRP